MVTASDFTSQLEGTIEFGAAENGSQFQYSRAFEICPGQVEFSAAKNIDNVASFKIFGNIFFLAPPKMEVLSTKSS